MTRPGAAEVLKWLIELYADTLEEREREALRVALEALDKGRT